MSKKDYRRGIKEGRRRASTDVGNLAADLMTIYSNGGRPMTVEDLALLWDAADVADRSLKLRLNKSETGWK